MRQCNNMMRWISKMTSKVWNIDSQWFKPSHLRFCSGSTTGRVARWFDVRVAAWQIRLVWPHDWLLAQQNWLARLRQNPARRHSVRHRIEATRATIYTEGTVTLRVWTIDVMVEPHHWKHTQAATWICSCSTPEENTTILWRITTLHYSNRVHGSKKTRHLD
jgi:hypothetical protein